MALKLPRFLRTLAIVQQDGTPTLAFHQWWESVLKQVEQSINAIQDALIAAGIANAAAVAAQNAANVAQSVAKLTSSGMTGLTLSATDAGTSTTVSVSNHTRVYGDGTSVSVTGGNIPSLAYATQYVIYYNDPEFDGGSVTYLHSTDLNSVSQTGTTHIVGVITTPAAGQPPEEGAGPRPPGFEFNLP